MNSTTFAPVALFTFKRLEHTIKTIEALKNNTLASKTDLIIFSDEGRTPEEKEEVATVRKYIKSVIGFKSIKYIDQKKNIGLATSIINGVSDICNEYGRVIVLEDDLETSIFFLEFMNNALNFHKDNDNIISISGFSYPIDFPIEYKDDTYLLRIPLCWGWATWKERWSLFEKKLSSLDDINLASINYINFNNTHDFFSQAIENKKGKLNTWFIFWYIASALNRKKTVFPKYTLVKNIGHDGSGENCNDEDILNSPNLYNNRIICSNLGEDENKLIINSYELFFKKIRKTLYIRVINKMRKIFYGIKK